MAKKKLRPWRHGEKRVSYSDGQRAAVLADVPKLRIAGAARKHKIPARNVSRWKAKQAESSPRRTRVTSASDSGTVVTVKSAPAVLRRKVRALSTDAAAPRTTRKLPTVATPVSIIEKRTIAKSYTPSRRAVILEYAAAHTVAEAATEFGASRISIYDWQRKLASSPLRRGRT
jgi:hypothetical protein